MRGLLKRILPAVLAASVVSAPALADDTQLWNAIALAGPVKDDSRLLLWFDGHARFRDDASDLGVTIIRPAVGWQITDNVAGWAGYARVVSRRENAPDLKEHRIWQQATFGMGTLFGGSLSGRTRLEQRLVNLGDDTGWRFRQFVRYSRPFENPDYSAIIWNELFVGFNDTDWGARSGYDQNRTFIGAGWQASKSFRLEGGYMFNHINRDGAPNASNHVVSFMLAVTL